MLKGVVVFAGTVGAGKSTQMHLAAASLRSRGVKVRTAFLKSGHIAAFALEHMLVRISGIKRKAHPTRILTEERPELFKRLFGLWVLLDLLSISVKFLVELLIPLKLGFLILVEEYLPATIADYLYLAHTLNYRSKILKWALTLLVKLLQIGKPVKAIFMDASDQELKNRWTARGSFEESLSYISMQRMLLPRLLKEFSEDFTYMFTAKSSVTETHVAVINLVYSLKNKSDKKEGVSRLPKPRVRDSTLHSTTGMMERLGV